MTRHARRSARKSGPAPQLVPAVAKAIAVIRMLNQRGATGVVLSDISDPLKITRSHCYNILRTLSEHGWVSYDGATRRYRLGSVLAADSTSAMTSHPYLPVVRPAVDRLADQIGLPCTVCEPLNDGTFLVVHTAHYPDPSISAAPIGYRFPPTAAPQFKAKLAWLTADQRDGVLARWQPVRHTETTIMDRAALERDVAEARRRGWVRSRGEFVEGFSTLALPIFDRAGDIVLIVSCAARAATIAPQEAKLGAALAACANEIHGAIDGRPPVDFPRP